MELFPLALILTAAAYATVGHGGASAYLALMAILGFAPAEMRPLALTLNLFVSALASYKFYRAGHFNGKLFLPLILASFPMAWLGGSITLSSGLFKILIGLSLAFAALNLVLLGKTTEYKAQSMTTPLSILTGAIIGIISGLTGVGGGIYLSPILIFGRFANLKQSAALSAPFIFLNSAAGLIGMDNRASNLPASWPIYAMAVILGGYLGSQLGSKIKNPLGLRYTLAGILAFAAFKFAVV